MARISYNNSPIELDFLLTSNKEPFFYDGKSTIQQLTALYVLCVYCTMPNQIISYQSVINQRTEMK